MVICKINSPVLDGPIIYILKCLALVVLTFLITAIILNFTRPKEAKLTAKETQLSYAHNIPVPYVLNTTANWRHVPEEKKKRLSKLGKILFFDEKIPEANLNKKYTILVWKYGTTIGKRHIYHFGKVKHDPFSNCSVQNCQLSYKDEDLDTADLVIIHLQTTKGKEDLPPTTTKPRWQRWAFSTDESPYHTFIDHKDKLKDYNGLFNWSMTYRMDSDIPVPYGRTTLRHQPIKIDIASKFIEWKKKKRTDVLIAIMGSNCGSKNHRWEYVKALKRHIGVDMYGGCGTFKCPEHFDDDCPKLNDYMFYLAFENSNCEEYTTEKVWWNAYHKESIPIVMGASKQNLTALLPPGSYVDVKDFASPQVLAGYIKYLNRTPEDLIKYFAWQKDFQVHNEHGYFKSNSYHYCRACEALNYNDKRAKVYDDLKKWWSVKSNCFPSWDYKGSD